MHLGEVLSWLLMFETSLAVMRLILRISSFVMLIAYFQPAYYLLSLSPLVFVFDFVGWRLYTALYIQQQ